MELKVIALLLLLSLKEFSCANILAIFPFPGVSHFMMFGSVLKELANRGHHVDVISHFPSKTPIERYNDISIRGSSLIVTNNITVDLVRNFPGSKFVSIMILTGGPQICENSFNTPQLQQLKNTSKKYDVVLSELFATDCMLGWAWHFGVPSIVMTSSANLPWAADRFGLPDNPSYIPNYFVEYGAKMTLYERIVNAWWLIETKLIFYWYSSRDSNRLAKGFFGENLPDLDILARNTSLQLINTHFSVNHARPLVPNIIDVGGLHIQQPKPVNEHIDKVLTTDKRGLIYFTMGSLILTETLPNATIQALFDAFAELPYKVVWKATRENFPKELIIPENIHFEHWLPQLDLLCDPRVKLFISHGGMMSIQEAIYCGVPILGIPLFADQSLNIRHAESMGSAIMVKYDDISKDTIFNAAKKLLNDPTYISKAKQISEQFKDRPLSVMDTAIYWIEYVIKYKGAPQLQSAAKYLAWYQYYLLDVVAVVIGLPLFLVVLFIKFVRSFLSRAKTNAKHKIKTK